jgi:hypothetical protein
MGLIGGIIGGIGSAAAGIIGGRAARKAANRNARLLAEAEEDAKAWYDKEYNSNYLDRADARATLAATREMLADRYRAAEGSAAVTGATEESLARQKAAANEALSDVTSNLAQSAEAHKEAVRANYEAQQEAYRQEKTGVNNQKALATVQAAQGVAQSAQKLGDAFGDAKLGDLFKKSTYV